jgi:RNA polymerase sigma-70 factor, ECF subfamily
MGIEATIDLLKKLKKGDTSARDRLLIRYLPILKQWAHRRLPVYSRDLQETDDLVQNTLIRALSHLDTFEYRREGAFLAYLRQILLNTLRDEARRVARRPVKQSLEEAIDSPSLVVQSVGAETMAAYESALSTLPEVQREAVVLRVEFGYSFQEIAEAVGSPSTDAARMMVTRALARLAQVMDERTSG